MFGQSAWDVDRFTLVGWVVFVANMLACCVVVPMVIINLCPGIVVGGVRIPRSAMIVGFLLLGPAGFSLSKWLLEKLGVTVLRPPQANAQERRPTTP